VDSSPAIDSDGTIYFGSDNHKIYALDSDGSLEWSYKTGDMVESALVIGPRGGLYVASDDLCLYAFWK
jgi:outer membrane protein assembly factor BamB